MMRFSFVRSILEREIRMGGKVFMFDVGVCFGELWVWLQ